MSLRILRVFRGSSSHSVSTYVDDLPIYGQRLGTRFVNSDRELRTQGMYSSPQRALRDEGNEELL